MFMSGLAAADALKMALRTPISRGRRPVGGGGGQGGRSFGRGPVRRRTSWAGRGFRRHGSLGECRENPLQQRRRGGWATGNRHVDRNDIGHASETRVALAEKAAAAN